MSTKHYITMQEVQSLCRAMVNSVCAVPSMTFKPRIYGVPRGGVPVAMMVAGMMAGVLVSSPEQADLIVDDIFDSGATAERYSKFKKPFFTLIDKRHAAFKDVWLVMPWEQMEGHDASADDVGIRLLQAIGEDPQRGGLLETPKRFLAYMRECTSGMDQDPKELLKTFDDGAERVDEMVVVANIPFYSMCEHHLAPFFGQAHIAYIPGSPDGDFSTGKTRIVGLSKLARVLEVYARRLQVQERITNQIADLLADELGALGVGVALSARHLCMESRGVRKSGAITYTSALRGAIKDKSEARSEFLRFVEMANARMGAL